jgi:uncharacterized protein involved in oxidation of intracellular sulfur
MKYLFVLNNPPYGTECSYNGLRLANVLLKSDSTIEVTVFLMADAVTAARSDQQTPHGYYDLERMLHCVLAGIGKVLLCGTCMDARGLSDSEILAGARRSSMDELAAEAIAAEKTFVF